MLLCRHLLLRVNIPKFVSSGFAARRFLVDTVHSSSHTRDAHHAVVHVSKPLPRKGPTSQDPSPAFPIKRTLEILRRSHLPSKKNATGSTEGQWNPLQAYEALRAHNRKLVANLPVSVYTHVAKQASQQNSSLPLDNLVMDLVDIYKGTAYKRIQIFQSILILTARQQPLRRDRVLSLLSNLKSFDILSLLGRKVVLQVVLAILREPIATTDKPLLDILSPLLLTALRATDVPPGTPAITYEPPPVVRASFAITHRLLEMNQDEQALDLFQALVDSNNIPPEALLEANNLPAKFTFIIRSTLVQSCLHWNWRNEAVSLLFGTINSSESSDDALFDLTVNTIYALLEAPSTDDIVSSGGLIRALDKRSENTIPHGLIRLYYESARYLNKGEEAESLYSYTRSPSVLEREEYPPPQGRALTWLMRYLTLKSRNMHLGRVLSKHVVESSEPIPLYDRAHFIAIAAARGYATQARALWERYSVGKDKDIVVGNAATVVRIVSLFSGLIKQTHSKLQTVVIQPSISGETIKDLRYDIEQDKLEDLTKFVDHVVAEFQRTKEPLANASHFHLTSLARSYFILGRYPAGLRIFKILMDRKEVPDLCDLNVAMSAMAKHDPRGAAKMIERMIENNLQPDAITFGTVLHHALVKGEMTLVDDLIRRVGELEGQLSPKSVSALIRASLQGSESKAFIRSNLERVFKITQALLSSSFVCQPNTGKYCIFASLRVGNPVMAFRFWKLLVKDRTEWEDREQLFQRRLMADMIQRHCEAGWLSRERGTIMLSLLGEKDGFQRRTVNTWK